MRWVLILVFAAACGGSMTAPASDAGSSADAADALAIVEASTLPPASDAAGGDGSMAPAPDCHAIDGKITALLKNASSTYATEPKTVTDSSKPVILLARAVSVGTGDAIAQAIYSPGAATQFWKLSVQEDCSVQLVSMQTPTKCLDAGPSAGPLTQQTCDATSTTQRWILTANVDKTTTLPNYTLATADSRCVEVASASAGATYAMKPCDGSFAQQYYLPGAAESVTAATFPTYFKPNLALYTAPLYKSTTPNINPYTDSAGHTVPWQLLLPPDYDQSDASKTYPVVVYLHGSGQSGTSNNASVITNGAEIFSTPEMQEKFPAIVIVPQCPTGDFCWGIGMATTTDTALATHELVEYVMTTYHGDPKRVYVAGLSIGGVGTWDFIGRWSDLFVAAFPMSGATKADEPHTGWLADNVQEPSMYLYIPIWATNGASDTTIGIHDDVNAVPEIDSLAGGETRFSLIQCETGVPANPCGHGAWSQIVQTPGTLDWLFSQSR